MKFDPDIQKRRSIRLRGYDYSGPGVYFMKIYTFQKECLLGEIKMLDYIQTLGKILRTATMD